MLGTHKRWTAVRCTVLDLLCDVNNYGWPTKQH